MSLQRHCDGEGQAQDTNLGIFSKSANPCFCSQTLKRTFVNLYFSFIRVPNYNRPEDGPNKTGQAAREHVTEHRCFKN